VPSERCSIEEQSIEYCNPQLKSRPYIYDVKFLALLGVPYTSIYDISRLRFKDYTLD
jgi:hypothetical protein